MKTRLALPFVALLSLSACGAPVEDPSTSPDAVDGKEDALRTPKFETFTGEDGKSYFHLLAGNGEKVLASQGYASKESAQEGIATVKFNGAYETSYQLLQAQDGQWYFNLLGGNWEVIATSELYVTRSNADRALTNTISLVKRATTSAAPTTARFTVFQGQDGKYYFNLRAGNGEIVLRSQGYTRRASAVDGEKSVLANGPDATNYQIRDAASGQTYFVLVAGNGQVIGQSELYATRGNTERAIGTVAGLLANESLAAAQ